MDQVLDRASLSADALSTFKTAIQGDVFVPGDQGFDEARAAWNLVVQHQPAIIVIAANESDVQAGVRFARQQNLPIAVQATGHGQFRTCEGGLLLIVNRLDEVEIDPQGETATVGGGTVWGKVIEEAYLHNLVPISGSAPGVGVVGYILGGGYGILSRKHGLAADHALSFRIVTPSGEILDVSPESHPDLFWAVMGGGGSYGVITRISFRLFPHGEMFGGSVMFDASLANEIYPTFLRWTQSLPHEVSAAVTMMTYPPAPFVPEFLHGRSMLLVSASVLTGQAQAEELLAPIRSLPGAEFDSFQPMTYDKSAAIFNDPVAPMPAHGRGVLLQNLNEEGIATLLDAIGTPNQSPNIMIQLRHLEGAMSQPGAQPNAVGDRRRGQYALYFVGVPMGPVTSDQMEAHAESVVEALQPYILARGPLNWLGEANVKADHLKDAFSEDEYARLKEVKQDIDPDNFFRYAGVGLE